MDFLKGMGRQSCITVFGFCILLFGFTAATIVKPSSEFSETENRVLAQMPEMKAETIWNGGFEADYEAYLTDQFVWRNQWIGLKTSIQWLLLKREVKDIYFAEDGYLIEKHTGTFSSQMARRNIEVLSEFARQYEGRSEHISVLIVPNAVDILQDKLPPFADLGGGNGYLEQIAQNLPEGIWFDSAAVLRGHADEELYYRTDHHWKTLAAFYVYQAWARRQGYAVPQLADYEIRTVTESFEGTIQSKLGIRTEGDAIELFLPVHEIPCVVYRESTGELVNGLYDYEALDTKDKYAVFLGGNEPFLQIRTEMENGRKILVIKDSYANCFIPFLVGEFQKIDVLDLRYTNRKLSELIETGGYTDLLVLYNASGFAEDMNIAKLTS